MRTTQTTQRKDTDLCADAGAKAGKMQGIRTWLGMHRTGVTSVLAMMMAILVGALAVAMGTVTQGNLRNASTHLHVMRAMQAAETGLKVAELRLANASRRFVVEKGEIDITLGTELWHGDYSGGVDVMAPITGHLENYVRDGLSIAEALDDRHAADLNVVEINGIDSFGISEAPAGTDLTEYQAEGWVFTPAIALREQSGANDLPTAFQIIYAPLANGIDVRVLVTGYDFDPTGRPGRPLTRVISQDFRLLKTVDTAIVSQSRIMIGKNVHIEGDLGTRFDNLTVENGKPMLIRSDFVGLDPILDTKMVDLYTNLALHDVDGDNRLRIGHPLESSGLFVDGDPDGDPLNGVDYDGDGTGDGAFADVTGDGFVDEFDLFISHFDSDGDGKITIGGWPAIGTPAELESPEFMVGGVPVDVDLAFMIDASNPDRNDNGIAGFYDDDGDGIWDPGSEDAADYDAINDAWSDQVLGYRDGYIDYKDKYVKIDGQLVFRASAATWAANQGNIYDSISGSIRPRNGSSPLEFDASDDLLPDITAASFAESRNALYAAADGAEFWTQVAANLGIGVDSLGDYVELGADPDAPQFQRLDADDDLDGLPDNFITAYWEKMPFNSPSQADWYYRPVFTNMIFMDVVVPVGLNGLFVDCTMVGVTRIEGYTTNTHINWPLYGGLEGDGVIPPSPRDDPLDKSDFDRYVTGVITDGPSNYDDFPDPPTIDSAIRLGADRDTKKWSNNVRFHDTLFVGSLVADVPENYTHLRNKLQLTGACRFTDVHPSEPNNSELNPEPGDLDEIAKSSLMAPNYSVDIGTFNSPPEQNIALKGAVVAGILDIRGNASIDGALLLTFKPVLGESPLVDAFGVPLGNPADFNASIGYFGPDDGDAESLDPATLPEVDGVKIIGWDLNGDGLADLGPDTPPSDDQIAAGAVAVPFHGYGRIDLRFNPDMVMPDGLMLPLSSRTLPDTYREGTRR